MESPKQDHIVYNSPSSPPSVFDTPLLFLPKDDKRRKLFGNATTSTLATSNPELPPLAMPQAKYERHHLTEEDVAEIKRLRMGDPENWSTAQLARKFNCSARFIAMCCETTEEKVAAEKEKLERVKARWGPKRRKAREDRAKRKEIISRDE
jgi:Mitochondrial ribosomal protein subunit L20